MAENPIENPNSESYKSISEDRLKSLRSILSTIIKTMPREEVIKVLKQKKIIKYEYSEGKDDLVLIERVDFKNIKSTSLGDKNGN